LRDPTPPPSGQRRCASSLPRTLLRACIQPALQRRLPPACALSQPWRSDALLLYLN
jgi:hypothetical protein